MFGSSTPNQRYRRKRRNRRRQKAGDEVTGVEKQITFAKHGHILTNTAIWSPDGRRIVYDVRSDAEGSKFDGTRIESVDVETGQSRVLYESRNGACCGVATYHPK